MFGSIITKILPVLMILLSFTVSVSVANIRHFNDISPPTVEKTDPENDAVDVFPMRHIHFWLCDQNPPSSGIDFESVSLSVESSIIPITIVDLGNNRAWAHTSTIQNFPENSMITAVINARDNSGNRMEPYVFSFHTAYFPDAQPPVFSDLFPAHESTDNMPLPLISCKVTDVQSGIDIESVVFSINETSVNFTYLILDHGYQLFCFPNEQFAYETWVDIAVSAKDNRGNHSKIEWSFKTAEAPPYPPRQFFPVNNALLNYQKENGQIRFVWSAAEDYQCFRIMLKAEGSLVSDVIDVDAQDCWSAASMLGYNHPVSFSKWYQYSCRQYVKWSIAVLDEETGQEISNYSDWSMMKLAPPDAVVLRTPANAQSFGNQDISPLFTWDPYNNAQSYYFGLARIDYSTGILENVFSQQLSSYFNSYRIPADSWNALGKGNYIWAVIAVKEDGSYSDFMNYSFSISHPAIIKPPLIFN